MNVRGGGKEVDKRASEVDEKTDLSISKLDYYDGRSNGVNHVSSTAATLLQLQHLHQHHQPQWSQSQQQQQQDTDSGFPFADEDAESTPTSADRFSRRSLESPVDQDAGSLTSIGAIDQNGGKNKRETNGNHI